MQLRQLAYLLGAILLCACLTGLQASPRSDSGWRAEHLLGNEDPTAIRDGWFDEQALYLVRLSAPALAFHRPSQLMSESPSERDSGRFTLQSDSAQAHLARLDSQREDMLGSISSHIGRTMEPRFVYRLANNGFAAKMTPAEAETVAALPGVRAVHRDHELELYTDAGPEWIGAPAIWSGDEVPGGVGSLGEGVVFGIIDTGIAHDNPSFAEQDPEDGYVHQNPLGPGVYRGDCAPGGSHASGFCNEKLIGMYSYAALGGNPVDTDGHGSHVAGTAAGNHVSLDVGDEDILIKGVAPRGNIISYNACCQLSTLTAAMEDALEDFDALGGAPMVINYSIGAPFQTSPWERFDGQGFLALREAGVFVAAAAGNSGPGEATIGMPAVAPWIATAANSTHNRQLNVTLVSVSGPGVVPGELENMDAVQAGAGPEVQSFSDWAMVFADDVDAGNDLACDSFTGTPFDNAIAVIRRGQCTFADKLANAADAGADFVLMVNNEPRPPIVMGFEGSPPSIPAVMVSQADGEAVIDWIDANTNPTLSLTAAVIVENEDAADHLNDTSSRGPVLSVPSIIGPELAAPGTDIIAAVASQGGQPGWAALTGTSMASPHVAGAGGLLMAAMDWTPGKAQSAMMMTAERGLTDFDGEPANMLGIGAGRVDLSKAARAGFVLDVEQGDFEAADPAQGGDPGTLNLPAFNTSECDDSCSFTRTLTGTANGDTVEYTVSFDLPTGMSGSVDTTPSPYVAGDGVDQDMTFILSNIHSAEDRFGWVEFTPSDTSLPTQHMPVYLGNLYGALNGWLLEVGVGREGAMTLYREDASGQEEIADQVPFRGEGGPRFVFFSLVPELLHSRLEIMVDGYEDLTLDNDGQGWTASPGEEFDLGIIQLQRLPFQLSGTEISDRERSSLTLAFDVETNGWGFDYEIGLRLRDRDRERSLDSGTIDEGGATESFEFPLVDLVCGTDYEVVVRLRHLVDGADYQEQIVAVSTRSCFDGGGDGMFSCSMSDGSGRWDPVMPLMFMMALMGIGMLRRRQLAVKR